MELINANNFNELSLDEINNVDGGALVNPNDSLVMYWLKYGYGHVAGVNFEWAWRYAKDHGWFQ